MCTLQAALLETQATVRLSWKNLEKNVNKFSILHAIVTQLMPIDWHWKLAYYTRNSASYNIEKNSKLKNHPLSKAYRRVICVPAFVSIYHWYVMLESTAVYSVHLYLYLNLRIYLSQTHSHLKIAVSILASAYIRTLRLLMWLLLFIIVFWASVCVCVSYT